MEKIIFTPEEKADIEEALIALHTSKVDYEVGMAWYNISKNGRPYSKKFEGLCDLFTIIRDGGNIDTLKNKLKTILDNNYTGPKEYLVGFWFPITGENFIKHRILFLEYVLKNHCDEEKH